jgi:putative spermidine/putrescine transport system ATP-binding protein
MSVVENVHGASVSLAGVVKRYGSGAPAVDDVSLTVTSGEFVTFLGPSGSGKTTTLNAIAGFIDIDSGSIEIDGRDIGRVPTYRRGVGMVFQQFSLFPHMSVEENVAYPLRQRKIAKDERARRVQRALDMVRLGEFARRRPSQLSGGQQQRVAVARAVVYEPKVLLMDEPFGALDRKLREELQIELKSLHRNLGITIIFVTHDQEEALVLSDRIAVFHEGGIQQVGSPHELYRAPATRFVASFLGESNIFEGTASPGPTGCVVATPDGDFLCGGDPRRSGSLQFMVRPEQLSVSRVDGHAPTDGAGGPTTVNSLVGTVEEQIFLGADQKLLVRAGSGLRITARVPASEAQGLAVGDSATVQWPAGAEHLLD